MPFAWLSLCRPTFYLWSQQPNFDAVPRSQGEALERLPADELLAPLSRRIVGFGRSRARREPT